jgi:hypothetical protein
MLFSIKQYVRVMIKKAGSGSGGGGVGYLKVPVCLWGLHEATNTGQKTCQTSYYQTKFTHFPNK